MGTILHVALQWSTTPRRCSTPFLPTSSDAVHRLLGRRRAGGVGADAAGGRGRRADRDRLAVRTR
jgi:hypothetical protein